MPILKFQGRRGAPSQSAAVNVAGVGLVKVGDTFEVSDDRAAELLSKQRHVFALVTDKKGKAQQSLS